MGKYFNPNNFPNFNVFSETYQFASEWASPQYSFMEALDRSVERTVDQYTIAAILLTSAAFPLGTQVRNVPALLAGRLGLPKIGRIYGSHLLPIPTVGGIGVSYLFDQLTQSRSQDEKSGASAPSVKPKTLRGNSKPSRQTRSGQTSKPFWSQGKPKCKKGFRYDFKRKLCVKIK